MSSTTPNLWRIWVELYFKDDTPDSWLPTIKCFNLDDLFQFISLIAVISSDDKSMMSLLNNWMAKAYDSTKTLATKVGELEIQKKIVGAGNAILDKSTEISVRILYNIIEKWRSGKFCKKSEWFIELLNKFNIWIWKGKG